MERYEAGGREIGSGKDPLHKKKKALYYKNIDKDNGPLKGPGMSQGGSKIVEGRTGKDETFCEG